MHIKPAGWVVIVLALVGAGFGIWHFFGPQLRGLVATYSAAPDAGPTSDAGFVDGGSRDASSAPGDAGTPLDAGLQDAGSSDAGTPPIIDGGLAVETPDAGVEPPPTIAIARSLPPLSLPPTVIAGSEGAALHLVATEQVQEAVVSVAALAAHPEAIAFGVRAVWLVGDTVNEAALLPSCDPAQLRAARLGVIGGSLSHMHLLAMLAGSALPPIMQVDSQAALEAAYADGSVNGGEAPISRRATIAANCLELAKAADPLVLVHKTGKPLWISDVAAAAPMKDAPPSTDKVRSFFSADTKGGFNDQFKRASEAWLAAKVIPAVIPPDGAVDRRLIDLLNPPAPKVEAVDAGPAAAPPSPYGFPSWVDTH